MCTTTVSVFHADEEYTLPCVEALLAGTLALMTGMAQAAPGCARRGPMASKIAENLRALTGHSQLSEPMRRVLDGLVGHWQAAARQALAQDCPASPRSLWADSPRMVQ